jgi:hypothetical protein
MSRNARLVPITALNGTAEDTSSAKSGTSDHRQSASSRPFVRSEPVLELDMLSPAKGVIREQVRAPELPRGGAHLTSPTVRKAVRLRDAASPGRWQSR